MTNRYAQIVDLKVLPNYTFKVKLEDDTVYFVDMKLYLKDTNTRDRAVKKTFDYVKINEFGGLEWPGGWDMCVDWIKAYGVKGNDRISEST